MLLPSLLLPLLWGLPAPGGIPAPSPMEESVAWSSGGHAEPPETNRGCPRMDAQGLGGTRHRDSRTPQHCSQWGSVSARGTALLSSGTLCAPTVVEVAPPAVTQRCPHAMSPSDTPPVVPPSGVHSGVTYPQASRPCSCPSWWASTTTPSSPGSCGTSSTPSRSPCHGASAHSMTTTQVSRGGAGAGQLAVEDQPLPLSVQPDCPSQSPLSPPDLDGYSSGVQNQSTIR